MSGFLDQFRKSVISSVLKENGETRTREDVDDKIALGVLLWVVAEADDKFLPEEREKIKEILTSYGKVPPGDWPYILNSIEQAAAQRIDLYRFTREVSKDLPYKVKVSIVENLFRIACADLELAYDEVEMIRKIAGLFRVDHKEFINAKLKIKKEFNIETSV